MKNNLCRSKLFVNVFFLLQVSFFGMACDKSLTVALASSNVNLGYNSATANGVLGVTSVLTPTTLKKGTDKNFSCQFKEVTPEWISIDSSSCVVTNLNVFSGSYGPYTVIATDSLTSAEFSLGFSITAPDASSLPVANTPLTVATYYSSVALESNKNYFATFSNTDIVFIDATNPYDPNVVSTVAIAGGPQALVSTGEYIHVAMNDGNLKTYDWSDKNNPVLLKTTMILTGGQNYDIATDGVDDLFIANTTNNRFTVVDVSNPSSPTVEFNDDSLASFAAGVAYAQGYVYVADYGGNIVTFAKDGLGSWQKVSVVATNIANPSRPFAQGQYLLATQYNGADVEVFSLADKATPSRIKTLNFGNVINVYSRVLIHYNQLYVTQKSTPATIEVHDISSGFNTSLNTTYTPDDGSSNTLKNILGPGLFRNSSFLYFVGSDPGTPANRYIRTAPLPLAN